MTITARLEYIQIHVFGNDYYSPLGIHTNSYRYSVMIIKVLYKYSNICFRHLWNCLQIHVLGIDFTAVWKYIQIHIFRCVLCTPTLSNSIRLTKMIWIQKLQRKLKNIALSPILANRSNELTLLRTVNTNIPGL